MEHTLKDLSDIKKQIDVVVTAGEVAHELDHVYAHIAKTARLKGFRPGKAPRSILEQHYRSDAESDTIRHVIQKTYPEAVQATGLYPVGQPDVKVTLFSVDKGMTYEAVFEIRPVFKVEGDEGLSLEKDKTEITAEELDQNFKNLQERMAQLVPITEKRKAKAGDVIVMDYQGFLGAELLEKLKAKDALVELGRGVLFQELETGIVEMEKGETRRIDVKFPEEWNEKSLAGKNVTLEVHLKDIKEKKLPELNDDFAKDLGHFSSLEEVRTKMKEDMSKNKEQWAKNRLRRQVIEKLISENKFSVPEAMIHSELEHMLRLFENNLKSQGVTLEQAGMKKEDFFEKNREEAVIRVKGALIFDEIAMREKINVTPEEVDVRIEEMAVVAGQAPQAWKDYYKKNNMLGGVAGVILEEKTLDFVLSKSKIKTKD